MEKLYLLVRPQCAVPVNLFKLLCLMLLFTQTANAQTVAFYGYSQSQGTYTELTDAITIATAAATSGTTALDEQVYTLDNVIPFSFNFDGQAYTSLKVHVNGYISFGASTSTVYDPISSSTAYSGVISLLSSDLDALFNIADKTGTISYQTTGAAPNREFVVQWSHFKPYTSIPATANSHHDWNFQARLKEDGTIRFVYNLLSAGSPPSTNAKVGLRGTSNADYTNRTASGNATSNWANTTAGTSSSAGVATNYSFLPQAGLTFTWTPPTGCVAPTAQPTGLVLANTGIIINAGFTAAAPAADRYLILRNVAGTTPNVPVNGTVYTTGQNTGLNSYVAYYGANTTLENNYNHGIRGNTEYVYTIYAVSSNCNGGPLYLTENPLTGSITNCPITVNGITAQAATTNSFTLNWPATENGSALPFTTVLEVATNNTFTSMVTGSPFTLTSGTLSQTISGLEPNTQYFFRAKNVSTQCESVYSTVGNIYTNCVAVAQFTEGFDGVTGTALPNCWSKILVSASSSTPTINVTTTDASSGPNNVSFYGSGADTDLETTKIILVSPELTNLSAGTHRLKFKARKTSTATSPSATGLRIVALDGNSATANFTVIQSFTELTTAYQEYTVYLNNYTGNGKYIGIQRIGGPTYSYLYVDDVIWEQVPSCLELQAVTATNATPTGATVSWTNIDSQAPAGGYEYVVATTNTTPAETTTAIQTNNTTVTLTTLTGGTTYYVFVRRICGENDKSVWKSASFTTIATTPAPWLEEFLTSTYPQGWTNTGFTLGTTRGATGNGNSATNIYKNLYGTAATGSFSTIAVGPLNANNYVLSFAYKQSAYSSPYAPLSDWGNYTVQVSTDFGTTWTTIATVNNEAGTGEYIQKTFSLADYQGQYVQVKIAANRTAGDFDLSFDNFQIKQAEVVIPPCTNAEPGLTVGDISCVTFTYNGQTVTYGTVRGADGNIWLQQNLGSSNIATAVDDADSYGDIFQWGRWADGHQIRTSLTSNAPTPNNPAGLNGGSDTFIIGATNTGSWWLTNATTDTWNAATPAEATDISGCDPCKAALGEGWQLPTQQHWTTLVDNESITNPATALASTLKLPATGYRSNTTGSYTFVGARGYYWSKDVANTGGKYLYIGSNTSNPGSGAPRGQGAAVRCIKLSQPQVSSVLVSTLNNAEPVITTEGGTLQLVATVNPTTVNQQVTWSIVAGSEFATVSATGLVTAVANGIVTVQATSVQDPTKFAVLDVTVDYEVPVAIESVTVSTENNVAAQIITENGTLQLLATVNPDNASQLVTWSTISGNEFATVSNDGLVTAIANGTITVRATAAADTTKFDDIEVLINIPVNTDEYCHPSVNFIISPITLISLGNINNATSAGLNTTPAYEDFTGMITTVLQGNTYPVTVKGNTNGNFNNDVRVFIDWNQDRIFDVTTELYTATLPTSTGQDNVQATVNITVPQNAVIGATRMRVIKNNGDTDNEDFDGCTDLSNGQVEDYTLNVDENLGLPDNNMASFTLYPNPTQNSVTIVSATGTEQIKVYNQLGQLVVTTVKSNSVNLANVAEGIYIIEIHFENGTVASRKVIKN